VAPATAGAYQRQGASTAMLDALNLADLVAAGWPAGNRAGVDTADCGVRAQGQPTDAQHAGRTGLPVPLTGR